MRPLALALLTACAGAPAPSHLSPPPLVLQLAPVVPGGEITLTVTGATPSAPIYFGFSPTRGQGPCPAGLGGTCLDLVNPTLLAARPANANGTHTLILTPPFLEPGTPLVFQVAQLGSIPAVSNVLESAVLPDADADGFGDLAAGGDDCEDTDPRVHPGATYWLDADEDGFGAPGTATTPTGCGLPAGYATNPADCNDNDPTISPEGPELPEDGIDQDCDGFEPRAWRWVGTGQFSSCGLDSAGEITCWGNGSISYPSPPFGVFTQLGVGAVFSCALDTTGQIACLGTSPQGQLSPPSGSYDKLFVGMDAACVLDSGGMATCWGQNNSGATNPPAIPFDKVATGEDHACGLRQDGAISCWGRNDFYNQSVPPGGQFLDVALGERHSCAVTDTHEIVCWGYQGAGVSDEPAGSDFQSLSCSDSGCCAADSLGELTCWGRDYQDSLAAPAGPTLAVDMGVFSGCAVLDDGRASCWGQENYGRTMLPGQRASILATTDNAICWLDNRGAVDCEGGGDQLSIGRPTADGFVDLQLGSSFGCAVDRAGIATCWGEDNQGQTGLTGTRVQSLSTGTDQACAIDMRGEILCVGSNSFGQSSPPAGRYLSVSTAYQHSCAINAAGRAVCWGTNGQGQATAPTGQFTQVVTGLAHTCGLRPAGQVECWGAAVATRAPAGRFEDLSARGRTTCATAADGSVACWGQSTLGLMPPAAPLTGVSVGLDMACGLDTDRTIRCWGTWTHGPVDQLPVP